MQKETTQLRPASLIILSELAAAERYFDSMMETGNTYRKTKEEYERISRSAEEKLDALALEDPIEATRIYARSNYFDEGIDPTTEIYLGHDIIIDREYLEELDTPEKRAAFIDEYIPEVMHS